MTRIGNYYDTFHFTDCNLTSFEISDSSIIIYVRNLGVFPGHPLNSTNAVLFIPQSELIFEDVKKSERIIYEYLSTPNQDSFKPAYTLIDGPFFNTAKETVSYYLEGVLEEPLAWVEWTIESRSFYLKVLGTLV